MTRNCGGQAKNTKIESEVPSSGFLASCLNPSAIIRVIRGEKLAVAARCRREFTRIIPNFFAKDSANEQESRTAYEAKLHPGTGLLPDFALDRAGLYLRRRG
jgi:hypothetical protein